MFFLPYILFCFLFFLFCYYSHFFIKAIKQTRVTLMPLCAVIGALVKWLLIFFNSLHFFLCRTLMKQNFLVTSYIVNAYISENNRNWKSLLKKFFFNLHAQFWWGVLCYSSFFWKKIYTNLVRYILLLFLLM
jgi:hypothetical protein